MATSTSVHGRYCFADVVRALSGEPPEPYSQLPGGRLYTLAALFAYILAHPAQFLDWIQQRWTAQRDESASLDKMSWESLKRDVRHSFALWRMALCGDKALLRGPEGLSREMFYQWNGTLPRRLRPGPTWSPPMPRYVRVRWYPDVDAATKWPEDLGRICTDVELDPKGDLDLIPAMRFFGLENCYVIDANHGKLQLSRKPVERLSRLAVRVLLRDEDEEDGWDRHEVIGIVEQPTQLLQEARELRNWLDEWKYFLEDAWKLPIPTIMAELYTYSVRYFYHVAGEVSSTVLLCFLAVFAVLLYTFLDTIALVHGKVVWPLLATAILPVLWVLIWFIVRSVRATLPWIRATLEAALLSGEEIEEWDRLQRRGSPTSSDRSVSDESVG